MKYSLTILILLIAFIGLIIDNIIQMRNINELHYELTIALNQIEIEREWLNNADASTIGAVTCDSCGSGVIVLDYDSSETMDTLHGIISDSMYKEWNRKQIPTIGDPINNK